MATTRPMSPTFLVASLLVQLSMRRKSPFARLLPFTWTECVKTERRFRLRLAMLSTSRLLLNPLLLRTPNFPHSS